MPFKEHKTHIDLIVIFGVAIVLTLCAFILNWDQSLAVALHDKTNEFAWFLRQYSNIPGVLISLFGLAFIVITPWRLKSPLVRRLLLIWLATLILGGGLLAGFVMKESFQRPRPRETVLLDGQQEFTQAFSNKAEIRGKSFPSGHAAMAFMMAVPFFALRRRKPITAWTILIFGIGFGCTVGWARMVLGAHFLTDIIWAGAVVLGSASIFSRFISEEVDIQTRYTLPFLAFVAGSIVYFNKFNITLVWESKESVPIIALNLPCSKPTELSTDQISKVEVQVTGYGAPLTYLQLIDRTGVISLDTSKGFYRDLACSVKITLGPKQQVVLPLEKQVVHQRPKAKLARKTRTHYTFEGREIKKQ